MITQYPGISSRAIKGMFFERFEKMKGAGWAGKLTMLTSSDQDSETYKWLGAPPVPREWMGSRRASQLREQGITITNKLYESTIKVSIDDLRRDKTGQLRIRLAELADRLIALPETLLTTLILNGTGSTNGLAADGQYFFDTDHSTGDSGTLKNVLTSSEYSSLNVNTAARPTAAEFADALADIISHFYSLKDDRGEPINGEARQFLCMVPTNMMAAAMAVAKNTMLLGVSGAVSENVLKAADFSVEVAPNPRLTSTTEIKVFRTDGNAKPFILQEEVPIDLVELAEGSDQEFNDRQHSYSAEWTGNVGYGMWEHAISATFS